MHRYALMLLLLTLPALLVYKWNNKRKNSPELGKLLHQEKVKFNTHFILSFMYLMTFFFLINEYLISGSILFLVFSITLLVMTIGNIIASFKKIAIHENGLYLNNISVLWNNRYSYSWLDKKRVNLQITVNKNTYDFYVSKDLKQILEESGMSEIK